MCYNFMLIMCNTGMRPPEAKNLRWRDIMVAQDRDGKEIVVLFVQGKGKSRKLVALKSVGDYLERIRAISKATGQDDAVFTTISGKPAKFLYEDAVEKMLTEADLKIGPNGTPRSTYCFRHTYATFRLSEGVDVYILADRVLQGMSGWEPMANDPVDNDTTGRASAGAKARLAAKPVRRGRTPRG
jgi:integrase